MSFRTEIEVVNTDFKIGHHSQILTIGSCFSEVMGNRLIENKQRVLSNPFGTVFNPLSISRLLKFSLDLETINHDFITENQGVWLHYDFHSSVWGKSKTELLMNCEKKILEVRKWLQKTDVLMLTFGTAYAYFLNNHDLRLVSNCHKKPLSHFTKALLDVPRIIDDFEILYDSLIELNPELHIILTVSPVRHTRDTLEGNHISKSVLRLATHYLVEHFKNVNYFPALEIMLDDLRDYRFYKSDLIHPNEQAEAYIYEKFAITYFDKELNSLLKLWQPLRFALNHRPHYEGTVGHRLFLQDLLKKLIKLDPQINLQAEILEVKNKLNLIDQHNS